MAKKLEGVPRDCYKYYRACSLDIFLYNDVATPEALKLYKEYVEAILNLHNIQLVGWAIVKDKYFDILSSKQIGFVAIIKTEDGTKALADVCDTNIHIVTREELDSYF